jgi:hypothetical protein
LYAVKPGTMRSFSIPNKTKNAKRMSRSCTATKSAPNDRRGEGFFEANETRSAGSTCGAYAVT